MIVINTPEGPEYDMELGPAFKDKIIETVNEIWGKGWTSVIITVVNPNPEHSEGDNHVN